MRRISTVAAATALLSSTSLALETRHVPDDQGPSCRTVPLTVLMSHYEDMPAGYTGKGGCIVCVINDVAAQIAGMRPDGKVGAAVALRITALVQQQPDGTSKVSLESDEPGVEIDDALPKERQNEAQRDLKLLEAKLKRFSVLLPARQDESDAQQTLKLAELFSHLRLLEQPDVAIELCDPAAVAGTPVVEIIRNPETGELTVVQRFPNGEEIRSSVEELSTEFGAQIVRETGPDGEMRESVLWPDGTITTLRNYSNGDQEMTALAPSGQLDHVETQPDGSFAHRTFYPDGTLVTEYRRPDGSLVETVTQRPDGWVERVDPSGTYQATRDDGETITVVEADRSGNAYTATFDQAGNLIESDSDRIAPQEPGRRYFEEHLGGTDWDDLPKSLKNRYADSELAASRVLEDRAREAALAVRERRAEAEREAADAALSAETDAKLAAIAAEQEEADRNFAAVQERAERRNAIEESRQAAADLELQYDEAIARGDTLQAARIKNRQDDLHESSWDLLQPNEEEEREMERQAEFRNEVLKGVRERAAAIAEADLAADIADQDAKDKTTGLTSYVSVGSEMQQKTSATTRMAYRERARARATQTEIERRLNDPATSNAEREVLLEARDLALLQEEGASQLLMDNMRISAAGYAIDVALTVTGGKLATIAARGATGGTRLAAGAAKALLTPEAQRTAFRALAATNRTLTQKGVLEVAGTGATRVATGVTGLVSEKGAEWVGKKLATDVGTPIANAAGRRSRAVFGDAAVDAAKSTLTKAGQMAATDVTEIPGKIRNALDGAAGDVPAVRPGPVAAATPDGPVAAPDSPGGGAGRTPDDPNLTRTDFDQRPANPDSTIRDRPNAATQQSPTDRELDEILGTDVLPAGPEPAIAGPRSADELRDLHTPGRDLTPDEVLRKAEAYNVRQMAAQELNQTLERQAVGEATEAEVQQARRQFEAARDAIQDARAAAQPGPATPEPTPAAAAPDGLPPGPYPDAPPARPVDPGAQTMPDFKAQDEIDTIFNGPRAPHDTISARAAAPGGGSPASLSTRTSGSLADDAGKRRADWVSVPESVRDDIGRGMRDSIDRAATNGDDVAKQLQKELDDGSLRVEFDPGLKPTGTTFDNGTAALNPMNGTRLRSSDELAHMLAAQRKPPPPPGGPPPSLADAPPPLAPEQPSPVAVEELTPENLQSMADAPKSPGSRTPAGGQASQPPVPSGLPADSARPSWVRSRDTLLHRIIDDLYPTKNAPPLHVTNEEGLRKILRTNMFEQPANGGASFSIGGPIGTFREGNIAVRIKPDHEKFVTFVRTERGLVPLPADRPGFSYIQGKHLQYLNPGRAPGEEVWVDISTR
jgi:hypothetical protein